MPKSITSYALIGLVILSSVMSLLYFYEKSSHKRTASEYALFVTKTQSLGEIQQQKNKEIEARQQLINETIVNSYENSIKQLEAYYEANPNTKYIRIDRVQDTSACSGGMSESTKSTERANEGFNRTEKTTARGNSETVLDLQKASQEIVQCLELINWTKANE